MTYARVVLPTVKSLGTDTSTVRRQDRAVECLIRVVATVCGSIALHSGKGDALLLV